MKRPPNKEATESSHREPWQRTPGLSLSKVTRKPRVIRQKREPRPSMAVQREVGRGLSGTPTRAGFVRTPLRKHVGAADIPYGTSGSHSQLRPYCNARTRRFGRRLSLLTRALFSGAVKHSPPKRLRNASAVAASGKQNRMWKDLTSYRFRPRRTGICRSRWNSSISSKTLRKTSSGSTSSTRCGKFRSFIKRTASLLRRMRRVISPNPPPLRASVPVHPRSSF